MGRSVVYLRLLAVSWLASGCGGTGVPETVRVLFVGNSRVYFHNQPAMLEALARANGRDVSASMFVEGGATLGDRIDAGALDTVRSRPWDAVVINDQSTWGIYRFVEGEERVPEAPAALYAAVDSFADAARAVGAQLLLLAHPRHRDMPIAEGDRLIAGFAAASAGHPGMKVVPLESAWRAAHGTLDTELYASDGNHPSPVGALLQAVAVYRALFGSTPDVVPSSISGPYVEEDDGILHPDSTVELVQVDAVVVGQLQDVVERAFERWQGDVARALEAPPSEGLPALPEPSGAIDLERLRGSWRGALGVYPRYLPWPGILSLTIDRDGGWTTSLRISFGGSPPDIAYPVLPISNEGSYLQFVDPDGPDGGFVRYRLVPVGDSLEGIAEFTNEGTVYGIGSVALGRPR